jgi:hypothetical protein
MFFSGDPTIKKKVDLGGRSTRERDRQKLLEQTKLEREQRHRSRVQSQSATRIQVWIYPLFHFAAEAPPPCPSPANPRGLLFGFACNNNQRFLCLLDRLEPYYFSSLTSEVSQRSLSDKLQPLRHSKQIVCLTVILQEDVILNDMLCLLACFCVCLGWGGALIW